MSDEKVITAFPRIEESTEHHDYVELEKTFSGVKLWTLTRKVDFHVVPILIFIYLLSYIDRGNVGNAKLFGAQSDLGMTSQDWNTGLTLLFVTYSLGCPPANMLVRRFGPRVILPACLFLVGISLLGGGLVQNRTQWFVTRLLLGLFESAMYSGCMFTLTTWYTPAQIQSRMSWFYLGGVISGAFSGLLAFGIGQLDGVYGWHGWRWIFVIEGSISAATGLLAFFLVPSSPAISTRWLSPEESRFLSLRAKFTYGKTETEDVFSWAIFLSAIKSIHTWIISFCFICLTLSIYGLSLTLPTIVLNMGFAAGKAQALSAPPYVFAFFCVILAGWIADRYQKRAILIMGCGAIGFIGLLIAVLTVKNPSLTALSYVAVCLCAGGLYPIVPAMTAWASLNSAGNTKRASTIAITTFFANAGGIPGSNIYIAAEAPGYPSGFGTSLAATGLGTIVIPFAYWVMIGRINKRRAEMSLEEINAMYTEQELRGMGDLSPLYRYER